MFYMELLVACIVIFLLVTTKSGFIYDVNKKTGFPELNMKWLLIIVCSITVVWSIFYRFVYSGDSTSDAIVNESFDM